MCLLCQARDPSIITYDDHGTAGTLDENAGGSGGVSTGLPSYNLDQIANQLTHGYWEFTNRDWRAFDVQAGDTLTYDISRLDAQGQSAALQAFEAWTAVSGLRFEPVTSGQSDILFMDDYSGAYAYSYLSGNEITRSFINVDDGWQAYGDYYLQTYIHELGHALGLGHAGDYNGAANFGTDADYQQDSWQYSILSYFGQWENGYTDASSNYLATTMIGDIAAIHALYGTPTDANAGDTIYGDNTTLSQLGMDLSRDYAVTIYDSTGTDTIDLGTRVYDQRLDLRGEAFSDLNGEVKNFAIARGADIENAITGSGDDTVTTNGADNYIRTGAGNDTLILNGGGNDTLDGGSGFDTLVIDQTFTELAFVGTDTLLVTHASGTAALFNVENLQLVGGSSNNVVQLPEDTPASDHQADIAWVTAPTLDDTTDGQSQRPLHASLGAEDAGFAQVGNDVVTHMAEAAFTEQGSGSVSKADAADAFVWTALAESADNAGAGGTLSFTGEEGAAGETAFTDAPNTDARDAQHWTSYTDTFDESGKQIERVTTFDDGRQETTSFLEPFDIA